MNKAQRMLLSARGELKQREERLASMRLEMADIENYKGTLQGRDQYEARQHAQEFKVLHARHEQERLQLGENPKFMLRQATGGEFNTRSAAPLRAREIEKPFVELPAPLQDKIKERAAQERHTLVEPTNDNRLKETGKRVAQEPELREAKESAINDNRRPEKQAVPQLEQEPPERSVQPQMEAAQPKQQADPNAQLHALMDQWNGQSDRQQEQEQGEQKQSESSQSESSQTTEDAELYAQLDLWNAQHDPLQQQVLDAQAQSQTSPSSSTQTAEEADLYAQLDLWGGGQEQEVDMGMSLGPE